MGAADPARGRIVHLAGSISDDVAAFLGPATDAVARAGLPQAVVHLGHEPELGFPASVDVVAVGPDRGWRHLQTVFGRIVDESSLFAVHLHGWLACALGARAMHSLGWPVPIFYSPHGGLASRLVGAIGWIDPLRPIATSRTEARALGRFGRSGVNVVERPVSGLYFRAERSEAPRPIVVTDGRGASRRDFERFAQLAILLSDEKLDIEFVFVGGERQAIAHAATVSVNPRAAVSDVEVAACHREAWIYVQPARGTGFPHGVASAMAAGLPCVVRDTDAHRDLIRHGENGLVCRSSAEMLNAIALLVDSQALRRDLGDAARVEAARRFALPRFRSALLGSYGIDAVI